MSVKEYASEQGYTVQEVLDKCKELGLKISKAGDILDDDSIIVLDNSMNLISSDKDTTHDDEEVLDEVVEDILSETNLIKEQHTVRKQKLNKRKEQDKNEYTTKRKQCIKARPN